MKNIVVLGAGDFGKEVAWLIEEINQATPTYNLLGYLDDDERKIGQSYVGYPCLGPISQLRELSQTRRVVAVVAMQDGDVRKRVVDMFPDFNDWETLVHPTVKIASTSKLGKGCVFCARGILSVDSVVDDFCIFNFAVTIGHDCIVEKYVSIMSGSTISGRVVIGEGAYLATHSVVIPSKKIGKRAKVGAGSVVIRNVKDDASVMGVPAKVLRF